MKFIADFHIHSKYSRATSKDMDIEHLDKWAKIKGIKVLGTGDFTHPEWLKNLKEKLEPAEPGLFKLKNSNSEIRFILTSEISCIYSKGGKVRKIHIVVFSPSFEICEKINTQLGWIGNLKSDGRPILGLDAKELAKIVLNASENCLVVPAHCLLPDTYLHSNSGIKKIKDISVGDKVFTHKGRLRKVKKIYKRYYKGKIYNIRPYNFRIGLKTTSEHPFYIIKSYKDCKNCTHTICKPACAYYQKIGCSHPYFKKYKPEWIQAKDIKKGDILIFPRFNNNLKDINSIKLNDFLKKDEYKLKEDKISPPRYRIKKIPNEINITKEFCRLIGYYISEGYTDSRDSISFCFNRDEKEYIEDLKFLMDKIFNLPSPRIYKRKNTNSIEIIYFSKILAKIFSQFFYSNTKLRRAHTKCLPSWMLNLPLEKQVEIFKGWWRGDTGCTSSRELMNQMKIILLRLGIIPSISKQLKEDFNKKYIHKIGNRIVHARYTQFIFHGLSFFQDLFGLLKDPCFNQKRFKTKLTRRHGWIDEKYIYIPVRDIEIENYEGKVYNLEVEKDNSYLSEFAAVHNCWTPWFSIFGSKSGFNSIEECFEEYSKYIYAGETGLSCYDDKTEVLTNNGWKRFSEIKNEDKICTLNPKTDEIEFQKPIGKFVYDYQGKMYRLKTKRVDLLVTPNHKLFASGCNFRKPPKFFLKESNFLFNKSKRFKKDGLWVGKNIKYFTLPVVKMNWGCQYFSGGSRIKPAKKIPIKPWLKFFGFWVAEGWTNKDKGSNAYNVCLSNNNNTLLLEMKKILESFGYNVYRDRKINNVIRVRNYQLFHYLKKFGKCYDKSIPPEIKSLSKGFLEILFEYYIKGDGHIYGRSEKGLSATTSSVRLRDDLQEIALKIGMSAYYKLHRKKGTPFRSPAYNYQRIYKQKEDTWVIYFIRQNIHVVLPSTIKKWNYIESWVDFKGKVYSLAVPNHVIYIRRNGIPVWCGNSDPPMNWRLSALDKIALISNSDAHSPAKIGREANVFDTELSYPAIIEAIKSKNPQKFLYTIEFFPEEGKYHYDGHRVCELRLSPQESKKYNNICPNCGKPLTIGVLSRVEELADRENGFRPVGAIPFKSLIPLEEVIAEAIGQTVATKKVIAEYQNLIKKFNTEFEVLLNVSSQNLQSATLPEIAEAIKRVREGKVRVEPGYDGVFGKIRIFSQKEQKEISKQKTLF